MTKKRDTVLTSWISWQRVFNNYEQKDMSKKEIQKRKEKCEELLNGYLSIYKKYSQAFKHYSLDFKWSVDTNNSKDYDLVVDIRVAEPEFEEVGPGGAVAVPDRVIKTPPPPTQPPAP
jgi:hypothetical protein